MNPNVKNVSNNGLLAQGEKRRSASPNIKTRTDSAQTIDLCNETINLNLRSNHSSGSIENIAVKKLSPSAVKLVIKSSRSPKIMTIVTEKTQNEDFYASIWSSLTPTNNKQSSSTNSLNIIKDSAYDISDAEHGNASIEKSLNSILPTSKSPKCLLVAPKNVRNDEFKNLVRIKPTPSPTPKPRNLLTCDDIIDLTEESQVKTLPDEFKNIEHIKLTPPTPKSRNLLKYDDIIDLSEESQFQILSDEFKNLEHIKSAPSPTLKPKNLLICDDIIDLREESEFNRESTKKLFCLDDKITYKKPPINLPKGITQESSSVESPYAQMQAHTSFNSSSLNGTPIFHGSSFSSIQQSSVRSSPEKSPFLSLSKNRISQTAITNSRYFLSPVRRDKSVYKSSIPLNVSHLQLSWSSVRLQSEEMKFIKIKNISNIRVVLNISIQGNGFKLVNTRDICVRLEPQKYYSIGIIFCPMERAIAVGSLYFENVYKQNFQFKIPLYGYGGCSCIVPHNTLKGPIGVPFLPIGDMMDQIRPLEGIISLDNKGSELGFAIVSIKLNNSIFSHIYDAFEIHPYEVLIPPGGLININILFKPRGQEINKMKKMEKNVITLGTMTIYCGDEANRQRIRHAVNTYMSPEEQSKIIIIPLDSICRTLPSEKKISNLDKLKDNKETIMDLLSDIQKHEIAITLNNAFEDSSLNISIDTILHCIPTELTNN